MPINGASLGLAVAAADDAANQMRRMQQIDAGLLQEISGEDARTAVDDGRWLARPASEADSDLIRGV